MNHNAIEEVFNLIVTLRNKITKFYKGSPRRIERFYETLQELGSNPKLNEQQLYILEELQLYAESIVPEQD